MSSQLQNTAQQVRQLGDDAKKTAAQLANYKAVFSRAVAKVRGTIGGSTASVDRNMIATFQQAEKEVDEAIAALQRASKAATDYAATLAR